ncbi:MAG TPA: AIM24 family protein, partial [Kofleriaceae bacterium]|nr:AIM24 family protein [Kofleriaceae bacterium]
PDPEPGPDTDPLHDLDRALDRAQEREDEDEDEDAAPEPVRPPPPPGRRTQPPPPPPGRDDARPQPMGEEGMITRALAVADPTGGAAAVRRVGVGQSAPQPVTEFATSRLIRPEDGDAAFEIGAGGVLVVRITDRIWSRTEEVVVSSGDLSFEPATRRVRGASTKEPFGSTSQQMFVITGKGYLVVSPANQTFTAIALDDDIIYVREGFVFAFEEQLRWESGHVPGSNGQMHVVQFRGNGCLAVRSKRPLLSLKLVAERSVYVESSVLAGWIGRVVPRLVAPAGGGGAVATFVECSGEGVVLIEDQGSNPAQG